MVDALVAAWNAKNPDRKKLGWKPRGREPGRSVGEPGLVESFGEDGEDPPAGGSAAKRAGC
jgi:hypothetical protein